MGVVFGSFLVLGVDHLVHHPAEYGTTEAEGSVYDATYEAFAPRVVLPSDIHRDNICEARASTEEDREQNHEKVVVGCKAGEEHAEDAHAAANEQMQFWVEAVLGQVGAEDDEGHEDCV